MKIQPMLLTVALAVSLFESPAGAGQGADCQKVSGKATWTLIYSPNDPFGRILGPATGDLKASISAFITNIVPSANGSLSATSVEVWVLGARDTFIANGEAVFTPLAGQPIGTISDSLRLTIVGGSGIFAKATGTLNVTGTGYDIFGPNAGPGQGYFDVSYSGSICGATQRLVVGWPRN